MATPWHCTGNLHLDSCREVCRDLADQATERQLNSDVWYGSVDLEADSVSMVARSQVHCVLQTTGSGALGISATDRRGDLLASEVKSVVD